MRAALKFARLSGSDKALFIWAFVVVASIRAALSVCGYQRLAERMPKLARSQRIGRGTPLRIAWAVHNVAKLVPKASCLTQAMAAQYMMGRLGEASEICVGVARADGSKYRAHAWLMWNGHVVIGANGSLDDFTPITKLPLRS